MKNEKFYQYSATLNKQGEFVCEPHESMGMTGQITVEPAPPQVVEQVVSEGEDTAFLSTAATLLSLFMAWALVSRRQGNG